MSRTGEEGRLKKNNCCLTCSIVCFVIFIVFILALYIGGTIMFKTYVSPHIGGLTLNDALALTGNVLSGKESKPTYSEEDLDSFYSGLSDAMFLSDKTEDELEYELLSEDTKEALVPASTGDEQTDRDADYDAFRALPKSSRYALLSDEVKALLTLEEYSSLAATTDAAVAARKKVGLKTYRLSLQSIMDGMDFGAEDFSAEKGLEKSLSSLEFNFDSLENYDIENAAAEQNEKFTTFSVTGNQVSAFINDLITYFLSMEDSPLTSALKDTVVAELDLSSFVTVASVTIMNTPLAVADGEAAYDQKDTALGVTLSIRLRDVVKAALATSELKEQLSSVPDFAIGLIPKLVPQSFSASLTVFPLAKEEDGREIVVTVNKPSDKNAKRLSTLVNALLGEEKEDASKTFFGEINDKIVDVFSSVNKTVKINFVPSKDKNGNALKDDKGNTYSEMKIMTWETVLALLDDQGRLSAHDVFTMLKCLYISKEDHPLLDTDAALSSFKSDMSQKYGVNNDYLQNLNVLSTDDLSRIVDNVDLSSIDLKESNDEMKIRLSAKALAAFVKDYVTGSKDSSVAAAEEEGSSSLLQGLDLQITDVVIKKVSEEAGVSVYSLELGVLFSVRDMLEAQLPSDGIGGTLSKKLLPQNDSFFGIKLYISEYTDTEKNKLVHNVGKNIDSPAEGETSAYLSQIRINDFSYAQTSRVFDAINNFMQVLSGSSFEISSITGSLEDAVNDVFASIDKNDFNLDIRLYEEKTGTGGLSLPSLYELLSDVVKPKLQSGESFDTADARQVLLQIYQTTVDVEPKFNAADADAFTEEINDKYYITNASKLTIDDLFGKDKDGNSNAAALSSKISANSIYFKTDPAETEIWKQELNDDEYVKPSIYGDLRSVQDLRVHLTGAEIAALVEKSGMVPSDVASSFGEIKVIGASFRSETVEAVERIYLTFDLALIRKSDSDMTFGNALPESIKLSAEVLLYQSNEIYSEDTPRFSTKVKINDADSTKTFLMLRAVGGDSLSEQAIADKIGQSLATTFNTLEGKIPLSYTSTGIEIADVFSFLIKETQMKDNDEDTALTDPQKLAERLRAFGAQTKEDASNTGYYDWVNGLKLFEDTDDDYIYTNMQRAYFLKETPDMSLISDGFAAKFNTIKTDDFNLNEDSNGLFYYSGDILNLKISDRALGKIVHDKQDLTAAIQKDGNSNGLSIEIKSLKLYFENAKLVIECGVMISFDSRADYAMMPNYFFIISKTVEDDDPSNESGYLTTISLNNIDSDPTEKLFHNITSLSSKGVNFNSLNKKSIEDTINKELSAALKKFPSSVTFHTFSEEDITSHYNETNYPDDNIRVEVGDGYVSFPSVYSYLCDLLYSSDKPTEKQLQSMIVSLHDPNVNKEIVTNEKSSSAYNRAGFKDNSFNDYVLIYSDKYLGYQVSDYLSSHTQTINDNIQVSGIDQTIILRALTSEEDQGERSVWKSRFFSGSNDFVLTDNYIIVTATVSLAGYSSGDAEKVSSILPENLCISVLIDLDDPSGSKGLLYNMSQEDMHFFQQIMQANNAKFTISDIAVELATIIMDTLDSIKNMYIDAPLYMNINFDLNYRLNTDDFTYTTSLPYSGSSAKHVVNEWNYKEANEEDDDHIEDGVGYVIFARGMIS